MFEVLSVSLALIGSSIAGIYDLKTTEIPDWASLGMIVLGLLISGVQSVVHWNYVYILRSSSVGAAFFTFGFLMYLAGQWGGGDAKVLAGIGALVPSLPSFATAGSLFPFPLTFLVNLFLIGAAYIIFYALGFAFLHEEILEDLWMELKQDYRTIVLLPLLPVFVLIFLALYVGGGDYLYSFLILVPGIFALLILLRFLRVIEEKGFKTRIDTEDLKSGDMLANPVEEIDMSPESGDDLKEISMILCSIWILPVIMALVKFTGNIYFYLAFLPGIVGLAFLILFFVFHVLDFTSELDIFDGSSDRIRGLEEEEVEKLRESKEKVEIREGVRFAPVFPIAVIVSLYFGNLLMFLMF